MGQHRTHHIGIAFRFYYIKQRMQGPVGVPQAKSSVIGKAIGVVDVLVKAFILSVYIHVYSWVDQRVVECRIKIFFGFIAAFNLNFVQLLFPLLLPILFNFIEIPT